MKYTVSLLLLVAIGHAADPTSFTKRHEEDDYKSAKRELLEGNYGLRIQPENGRHAVEPQLENPGTNEQQDIQSQEYSSPKAPQQEYSPPIAKISDVLTGQGPSFPTAIASHLYSPSSVYQPRLGSPTIFELSQPVPSQLRYSEHKIFNDDFLRGAQQSQNFESTNQPQPQLFTITQQQNYEKQESLRNTNQNFDPRPLNPVQQSLVIRQGESYEKQENLIQNFEPQKNVVGQYQNAEDTRESQANQEQQQSQQQTLQVNLSSFPDRLSSRPDISETFVPHLVPLQNQPISSEQSIQQFFPQTEGFPPDFFQQINQLGNQLSYNEETIPYVENPDDQTNREAVKENKQSSEQNASQQVQSSTEKQTSTSREQSSTLSPNQNAQPQALSYARFSQGLPPPSYEIQGPLQQILLQPLPSPSPSPLPQFQPLPQLQEPELFQPLPELQPPRLLQSLPQLPVQLIQATTPQPRLQPLPLQPLFQPLPSQPTQKPITTVAPLQPLFPVSNQSPQRIGIIRIRQGVNQLQNSNQQSLASRHPQFQSLPQNQQTLSTFQPQFTRRFSQNQQSLITPQPQFPSLLENQPRSTSRQPQFPSLPQNQQTLTTSQPQFTVFSQSQQTTTTLLPQFSSLSKNHQNLTTNQPQFSPFSQDQQSATTPQFTSPSQNQQTVSTLGPQFPSLPQNEQYLTTNQPQFSTFSQDQQSPTTRQPQFSTFSQDQQSPTTRQPQFTSSSNNQQTVSSLGPQFSYLPPKEETLSTLSQNQQALTTREPESFSSQEFDGLSNEASTVSSRSISESSSQSTESSSEPSTVSVEPELGSTLLSQARTTSQSPVPFTSTLSLTTLPSQPVTEAPLSTILTSVQPLSTLSTVSPTQPTLAPLQTSEPQPIKVSTQPQNLQAVQSVQILTSLEALSHQPILVTPQPLLTLQPYPVTLQPLQHEIPGIRAIPVQRYPIQPLNQPLIQVQHVEQQQPLQLVRVQPTVQVQFQSTPLPPTEEVHIQSQQLVRQSQYQSAQQPQSQTHSQQQKYQSKSKQQERSQYEQQQKSQIKLQSQQDKEAAIAHAQELLYELYSPFLQRPVYSETEELLIQQPQSAPLEIAAPYSVTFPKYHDPPAFSSTQYFGKHAHNILGDHLHYNFYKKK